MDLVPALLKQGGEMTETVLCSEVHLLPRFTQAGREPCAPVCGAESKGARAAPRMWLEGKRSSRITAAS